MWSASIHFAGAEGALLTQRAISKPMCDVSVQVKVIVTFELSTKPQNLFIWFDSVIMI